MIENINPIGGYMGLELPNIKRKWLHNKLHKFQSVRAAFLALLKVGQPKKIWMPNYLCGVMLEPLKIARIEAKFYNLDESFLPVDINELEENEWILYVNYFGVCSNNIKKLVRKFPLSQIVFDFSQAYFDPPVRGACATIYSPRKFFGVPDGGLLQTDFNIKAPKNEDINSIDRMEHLIKRIAFSAEHGYRDFIAAEESLNNCEPLKMSKLTNVMLASINYNSIKNIRNKNYNYLEKNLGSTNLIKIDRANVNAPLCYPYLTKSSSIRKKLFENKIYVPNYWPDAAKRVEEKWLKEIMNCIVALPIDQRLGMKDMDRILKLVS